MKKFGKIFLILVITMLSLCTLIACGDKKSDDNNDVTQNVPATMTGISIKTPATKTVFDVGTAFSSAGLVIQADYSDGTHKDLATNEYTVVLDDEDNFIYFEGKYTVNITYTANTEFKCSYDVIVGELKSISIKDGYTKDFLVEEVWLNLRDLNLTIIETYVDGTTKEVKGDDLYDSYYMSTIILEDAIGGVATGEIKSWDYQNISAEVKVNVYDTYTVTLFDFDVDDIVTTFSLDADAQDIIYALSYYGAISVITDKTGDRVIEILPDENIACNADTLLAKLNDGTAGTYSVTYTYANATKNVLVTLIDTTGYTLKEVKIKDATAIDSAYYVKEAVYFDDVSFVSVYTKAGASDITIPYILSSDLYTNIDELLESAGTKTLKFYDGDPDDTGTLLTTCEILVKELAIEDGTYIGYYEYEGETVYAEAFKKDSTGLYFYDGDEYAGPYTLAEIHKAVDENGNKVIYASFEYDDYSTIITINLDGTIANCRKLGDEDFKVELYYMGQLINTMYAFDGKLDQSFYEGIEKAGLGDLRIDSKTGSVIDSTYTFTKDSKVYIVYQQDATGQSFLGNYRVTDEGEEYGDIYTVNADGITDGESTLEYRFTEDDGVYTLTYKLSVTEDITMSVEIVIDGNDAVMTMSFTGEDDEVVHLKKVTD